MARTFDEIAQSIFNEKNSRPELNSLNSSSKAAIFRHWVFVAANAQRQLEFIQDRFEAEIDEKIKSNFIGTPSWYVERVNEFQLNDDLILINNTFQYPTIDASKQIIAASAFNESSGGTLTVKVAKEESEELVALTGNELTQLKKYITKIKLAGTRINAISQNADQLIMSGCTVFFDAIYDEVTVKDKVESALNQFMKNLPFDGKLKLNDAIDIIQNVEGVEDVQVLHLAIKTGSIVTPVSRIIELPSGYLNEADSPYTFDDLILYQPV